MLLPTSMSLQLTSILTSLGASRRQEQSSSIASQMFLSTSMTPQCAHGEEQIPNNAIRVHSANWFHMVPKHAACVQDSIVWPVDVCIVCNVCVCQQVWMLHQYVVACLGAWPELAPRLKCERHTVPYLRYTRSDHRVKLYRVG